MTSTETKTIGVPHWDGKQATCSRYLTVFEAMGDYYDCESAFDIVMMAGCPTKSEYEALAVKVGPDPDDLSKIKLWKANKKMCAHFVLGQDSDAGLAVLESTKTADNPQGVIHRVVAILKACNKPKDASAEIRLESKLEAIKFTTGRRYFDAQVEVLA